MYRFLSIVRNDRLLVLFSYRRDYLMKKDVYTVAPKPDIPLFANDTFDMTCLYLII